MAKNEIEVRKTESIFDELDRLHQAVSQRAYDLFRSGNWGGALGDWLSAERDLITKPAIELSEKDGQFEVMAALPGVDAKDLDVQITATDLLIKGETTHEKKTDKGTVHVSEFSSGRVFRSIHFPKPIDPDTVKAECKDGILRLTAAIAKSASAKKVDIKAA
jgi:HSP20 family protein